MKVYRNGVHVVDLDNPHLVDGWAEAEGVPISEITLDINEVRAWQVQQIRRGANRWFENAHGSFDGHLIERRERLILPLSAEDRAVRKEMLDNEVRRDNLVKQAKAATDWRACIEFVWTDPA